MCTDTKFQHKNENTCRHRLVLPHNVRIVFFSDRERRKPFRAHVLSPSTGCARVVAPVIQKYYYIPYCGVRVRRLCVVVITAVYCTPPTSERPGLARKDGFLVSLIVYTARCRPNDTTAASARRLSLRTKCQTIIDNKYARPECLVGRFFFQKY